MSDETRAAEGTPTALLVRMVLMLSVMATLFVSLHWYLGRRLIVAGGVPANLAPLAWAALWIFFGSIFAGFIGGRVLPRSLARIGQWLGFVWMGAFGLLLTATALSDLILWGLSFGFDVQPYWYVHRAIAVVAVVVPALGWGFYVSRRPVTKKVTVKVKGLDPALAGFRIAQISDVHIGQTLDRAFAQAVTEQVNALNADAVVVTGDLIDGSVEELREHVAPLGQLRGKHGVFYVTGNHEYYSGGSAWEDEGRRLGWTVLHNEHRVVADGKLVIGGVTDVEGARFSEHDAPDVARAFAGAPLEVPRVLLAHQPRFAGRAAKENVALMLSGHTHGGQIFPFMAFVKLQQPVIGGFAVIEGVPTYTSNGTGYWGPPFRIGPRGEVTELTLQPG